jgi:hypothetical protein
MYLQSEINAKSNAMSHPGANATASECTTATLVGYLERFLKVEENTFVLKTHYVGN